MTRPAMGDERATRKSAGWASWVRAGLLALTAFALAAPAAAKEALEISVTPRAQTHLHADRDVTAAGDTIAVALRQLLTPTWHSYWINPGSTGLETTIEWTLPDGVTAGPIEWPTPKLIPTPPLMTFGYEDEVVLVSEIRVPDDWPVGAPVRIEAKAAWLVCADVCIPEEQVYVIEVPTGEAPVVDEKAARFVAHGRASQPAPGPDAVYAIEGDRLTVFAPLPELAGVEDLMLLPKSWKITPATAVVSQEVRFNEAGLFITTPVGEDVSAFGAVIKAVDASGPEKRVIALDVKVEPGELGAAGEADAAPISADGGAGGAAGAGGSGGAGPSVGGGPGGESYVARDLGLGMGVNIFAAAILAFLGGVILNVMPCVFPVLALKALSLSASAADGGRERLGHGLSYAAGVVVSFLAFALILVALKSAGAAVGWGFQLQSPVVVALLAYVFVLIALNLAGVFELSLGRFANMGGALAERGGHAGSFFTGVLAAVAASPCTAPFMGAALGYALTQNAFVAIVVFTALGLGFAAPIVALSASPTLARLLPKPGAWMERFRHALAFPMLLAAAWLFWVLGNQAGVDALFAALVGAVLLGLAVWAMGAGAPESRTGRTVAAVTAAASLIGAFLLLQPSLLAETAAPARAAPAEPGAGVAPGAWGEAYDAAALAAHRAEGRPVFLNLTADWCISCKVNERMVLAGSTFREALEGAGGVYMTGDWTRRDPEISKVLEKFGRAGVPLYVLYPAGESAPHVLPQLLSERLVLDAIDALPGR